MPELPWLCVQAITMKLYRKHHVGKLLDLQLLSSTSTGLQGSTLYTTVQKFWTWICLPAGEIPRGKWQHTMDIGAVWQHSGRWPLVKHRQGMPGCIPPLPLVSTYWHGNLPLEIKPRVAQSCVHNRILQLQLGWQGLALIIKKIVWQAASYA